MSPPQKNFLPQKKLIQNKNGSKGLSLEKYLPVPLIMETWKILELYQDFTLLFLNLN